MATCLEPTDTETVRHFKAETRAGALSLAAEWWNAQRGLKQTLRLVFTGDETVVPGKACCWIVAIHFETVVDLL